MKNFDLNACGVQEMNAAEVAEVNGGFIPYLVVVGTALFWGGTLGGSFIEGFDAGRKS